MFAGAAYGAQPYAGAANQQETIIIAYPTGPYRYEIGKPIPAVTITCDDPDGGATTLSLASGALPASLAFSQTLPYTAPVPFNVTITGGIDAVGSSTISLSNTDGEGNVASLSLTFVGVAPSGFPTVVGTNPLALFGRHGGRARVR